LNLTGYATIKKIKVGRYGAIQLIDFIRRGRVPFGLSERAFAAGGRVSEASSARINRLLAEWGRGDERARDALMPVVYDELRRIARRHLWNERQDHTLQSAALVNEAYLRLARQKTPQWQNRAHFFGVAAQLMRQILVDHARNRLAAKRGAGATKLTLDPEVAQSAKADVDVLALDVALEKLTALDAQQGRLVEMRFFAGLSIEETATVLDVSPATVKREWVTARAWLKRELKRSAEA
jgi:RNA polymerase sigma factor (TIGR02999 family)